MLLETARPKVVIVAAALRSATGSRATQTFNRILDERPFIELPETFSSDRPEVVGADLFEHVRRLMDETAPSAT